MRILLSIIINAQSHGDEILKFAANEGMLAHFSLYYKSQFFS